MLSLLRSISIPCKKGLTRTYAQRLMGRWEELAAEQEYLMQHKFYDINRKFFQSNPFIHVVFDPELKQRKVLSKRYIRKGEMILESLPYVYTVNSVENKVCENCLKMIEDKDSNKYVCKHCKEMHYCSAECQQEHTSIHNKTECNLFKEMHKLVMRESFFYEKLVDTFQVPKGNLQNVASEYILTTRAVIKILARKIREHRKKDISVDSQKLVYEDVYRLISHRTMMRDPISQAMILEIEQLVLQSLKATKYDKSIMDGPEIVDLACKLMSNCVHIDVGIELSKNPNTSLQDMMEEGSGYGIYPSMCFINHSCIPNTEMKSYLKEDKFKLQFYAIHDIPEKTEITFSYIPLHSTNESRKKKLLHSFHFTCKCSNDDKNCNQSFLNMYGCKKCHEGIMVPTEPNGTKRCCFYCGNEQIGNNFETLS